LRRVSLRTRLLTAAVFALALGGARAGAAVIGSASAVQRGAIVELHFGFRGKGLSCALSAHGDELWIDLPHTRIDLPPRPLYGHETAPVLAVRAIDPGGTRSRLVIQVAGKTDYAIGKLPHELVIRLAPAGQAPNLAAPVLVPSERRGERAAYGRPLATAPPIALAPTAPPLAARRPDAAPGSVAPATAAASSRQPVVVIDPGHGGYDSGTEAGAPLLEKDLALQIALRLESELEHRGIPAILTRTGDYFVTLADRTALANKAGADLFISIHLNSSPDAATTGIETYYLNNTTDRATIRLAAMENASGDAYGTSAGGDLNYILSDMRQQYKANESVGLASTIEARTAADLDASLGLQVSALGAMRGPFYVLVGAQMPSVLVECGFLSNREEAARLASARYQQVLAEGVAEAVVHYFNADAAVGNL
jgi:N-acetylmuramoyl-L-alanine amidase